MASQWLLEKRGLTGAAQASPPPVAPVVSPVQKQVIPVTPSPTFQEKAESNPIVKAITAPQRIATAGLGKIGEAMSAPQRFVQNKLTGGQGYEKFYESSPIGKGIVKAASSKVVQGILPPAAAFSTPKRAAFASELALDPLNLVGAGVVSKIGKTVKLPQLASKISPVIKNIPGYQKARDVVGAFQYGYGVAPKTLKKIEGAQRQIGKAAEFGSDIAKPLFYAKDGKALPEATQKLLGRVAKLMTDSETRPLRTDEIAALKQAEPIIKRVLKQFGDLAQEQIKAGADPNIFKRFGGKYTGQKLYENTATALQKGSKIALDTSVYKKRKDLVSKKGVETLLKEIEQPAYGAAVAGYKEKKNLETLKLFKSIAKDEALSKQGFDKLGDVAKQGYAQIPKNSKYGVLSGSYVPKKTYEYINPLVEKGDTAFNTATKVFKTAKTILSPKQLGRNVLTSQVQAFLENPASIAYLPKAIKERITGGKFYKALKDTGEIAQSMPSQELGQFIPSELNKYTKKNLLSKAWELIKKPGSAIQNTNEEIAKTQSFIARLYDEAGKARITIDEALKRKDLIEKARSSAEAAAFNYQKVSPTVSKLRKGAIPFLTYPLKAGELTAKTAIKNPERLAAIQKVEQAVQRENKGEVDEQYLPEYLKQATRVTRPNEKGTSKYLNTKYLYPWGNMADVVGSPDKSDLTKTTSDKVIEKLATNIGITPNPFVSELFQQMLDKDLLTGKKLSETGRVRHAIEAISPSFVRSGLQAYDAKTKNQPYATSNTPKDVVIKETGLPLYKYNPEEGESFKQYEIDSLVQDVEKKRKKYLRDYEGKKSDAEIEKKMDYYDSLIDKIYE